MIIFAKILGIFFLIFMLIGCGKLAYDDYIRDRQAVELVTLIIEICVSIGGIIAILIA
jgi:TRAP-type C4-dicarboxylate transport system permease small subunit